MHHVHSLPCYESPAHLVSSRRLPLLLTACYLLSVSHGLLSQSLSVTSSLVDISPGREHLLYCPMLKLWSWNVACVRRVKLRLLYSLVDVEKPILRRID